MFIRPITTGDDEAVATALLIEGFPKRPAAIWPAFFRRLRNLDTNEPAGVPFGYLMSNGERATGVMMTPAMLRERPDGSQGAVINLSSWYVQPSERWRAGRMLQSLLKLHDAMFTDLTPTAEVRSMLPAFGFVPINSGVVLTVLPVAAVLPAEWAQMRPLSRRDRAVPEGFRYILERHENAGCLAGVLMTGERSVPMLFRKRWVKGMPAATLIYCPDMLHLPSAMPAIARFLVRKGVAILISDDTSVPLRAGQMKRLRGLKFARPGAGFAPVTNVIDHTASELALLDL